MLPESHPQEKKAGLAHWASRVVEECDKASQGFAADPVHDLRVAIRRCRSMADGFLSVDPDPAWKQMKRVAKPLFSSLGDLRDTQVMAEWVTKLSEPDDAVRQSLLASLADRETHLKAAAQHALQQFDRHDWVSLNAHLANRTASVPLEGAVFQLLALERWSEAYERHRQAMRNRSQVGYHQLRIGIKRFRYTVENFLPRLHEKWCKDLRDLQDALGEVHDFDVLRAMLRAHAGIHAEERLRWNTRISQERQRRLDVYRRKMLGKNSLWQVWRSDLPSGSELERATLEKLKNWAFFLDPNPAHSALVTQIALELFDGLSQCGAVSAQPEYRRILEAAASLHEVGRCKPGNGHQKRSYRLISRLKPPLGWTAEQLHCVAATARYHRGALPQISDSYFVGLSARRRSKLLPVIGMLRLADACAGDPDRTITRVSVERLDGALVVYAQGLQEISPGAERIARARYLLETTCRLPIAVRPPPTDALATSPPAPGKRRPARVS